MAIKSLRMIKPPPPETENTNRIRETLHRQMLDAVSHDLKTPLSTIIGSLEIHGRMFDKLTQEKRNMLINTALMEAYRLDNFITNILDMAKLEGDKVNVIPDTCNLTHLINDCLIRLGPKRDHANFTLLPKTDSVKAYCDAVLISRAVNLVLENAVKHGGKNPVIIIEYGVDGNRGFIQVRDHGPGIPAGKEKEIFLKYTRLAKADHQNAGTGLGLAICRQVMTLVDGTIDVENHPEGGAMFSMRFPSAVA